MYLTLSDYIVLGVLAIGIISAVVLMIKENASETQPENKEETK